MRRPLWVLLCSVFSAWAQPVALKVDPARSAVEFTLSAVAHTVHGTFQLQRGNLMIDPATGKVSGELVIRAASGESGNSGRDRKMHGDVLESAQYPEIIFRPTQVAGKLARDGHSEVEVHGVLTLHGTDHEIVVPTGVDGENGRYSAVAKFTVPYVRWGLKNPSNFFLRVSDKVDLTIRLVAQ